MVSLRFGFKANPGEGSSTLEILINMKSINKKKLTSEMVVSQFDKDFFYPARKKRKKSLNNIILTFIYIEDSAVFNSCPRHFM